MIYKITINHPAQRRAPAVIIFAHQDWPCPIYANGDSASIWYKVVFTGSGLSEDTPTPTVFMRTFMSSQIYTQLTADNDPKETYVASVEHTKDLTAFWK